MDKREYAIKRLEINTARDARIRADLLDASRQITSNPMLVLVGSYFLIETLQKYKIMPNVAGTVLEGVLVGDTMLNAVAKSGIIGELMASGDKAVKSTSTVIRDVAPLLLAAGAI